MPFIAPGSFARWKEGEAKPLDWDSFSNTIVGMILIYRRYKDSLDQEWHFHTECSRWPEVNFIEVRYVDVTSDRLCQECANLEATMFPPKE